MLVTGKGQARVDDDDLPVRLEDGEVLADLAEPPEGNDAQRFHRWSLSWPFPPSGRVHPSGGGIAASTVDPCMSLVERASSTSQGVKKCCGPPCSIGSASSRSPRRLFPTASSGPRP